MPRSTFAVTPRTLLAFLFSLFIAGCSETPVDTSVGTISGAVKDLSGYPIEGAIVTLGPSLTVTTDKAGSYSFTTAPGEYDLTAKVTGAGSKTQKVVVVGAGRSTIDFYLSRITTAGLLVDIPFSGNYADVSGNNNDGDAVMGGDWTADRFGQSNAAIKTSGADLIEIFENGELTGIGGKNFSMAIWIKMTSVQPTAGAGIAGDLDNFSPGYGFFSLGKSVIARLQLSDGSTIQQKQIESDEVNDAKWHLLVMTVDKPSNRFKFYVDGKLHGSDALGTGSAASLSQRISIGRLRITNQALNGSMDDFRMYNRALTLEEIGAMFAEGGFKP